MIKTKWLRNVSTYRGTPQQRKKHSKWAKKYTLFDDLDDNLEADATVSFSLEGTAYEIDLSNQNIAKLKAALSPFIAVARKGSRIAPTARSLPRKKNNPDANRDEIRYWASQNGFAVSDRGRIPVAVMLAYQEAHPADSTPSPQFSNT